MKRRLDLTLLQLAAILIAARSATGEELEYAPTRIQELVQSGEAASHGAQFAASRGALNCRTFLWKKSPDHHVFFFLRNGKSYGEFRDEVLSEGRFLRIIENYLVSGARDVWQLVTVKERPVVRREEKLLWKDGKWDGSDLKWSFMWCGGQGHILRAEPALTERILRRSIVLQVNPRLTSKNAEYYVKAFRPETTHYERAFGDKIFGEHYLLSESKLSDGRCTLRVEWPESRPQLVFELHERIPNPPLDATMLVHTKSVGSMMVKADLISGEKLHFEPQSP
jgi:hypothetical protein